MQVCIEHELIEHTICKRQLYPWTSPDVEKQSIRWVVATH